MSKAFVYTLLAVVLCAAVLAGIFPLFARQRENARSLGCQSNLQQLAIAMGLYTKDFGGKFPVARTGWANAIQPYLKSQNFGCPSDSNRPFFLARPGLSGLYNGYWYNGNLSGVPRTALAFPQATLLLGEGNDGTDVKDTTYNKTALPAAWLADQSKPCWRHLGGANYLYTDGHVKWLPPHDVTANFGRADCFAIK
jgi:prepilin-type processing-associated H-X9-DG protein